MIYDPFSFGVSNPVHLCGANRECCARLSKATGTFTKVLADMLGELKRRRCDPEDLAGLIKLCDISKRAVVLRYADRTIILIISMLLPTATPLLLVSLNLL